MSTSDPSTIAVCTYFLRNACNRGSACPYSHVADPSGFQGEDTSPSADCLDFTQDTKIADSSYVNFSPTADGTSTASLRGRQTSHARRKCLFFSQGKCTRGDACTYSHVPGSAADFRQSPCKFFGDGKCLKGGSCSFPHTVNELSTTFDGSLPSCKFFSQGKCIKGHLCTFKHNTKEETINLVPHDTSVRHSCKFFNEGKCNKGDACAFSHASDLSPASTTNPVSRAPYKATLQTCVFFPQGKCRNGDTCAFRHSSTIEQPQVGFATEPSFHSSPWLRGELKSPTDDHNKVDVGSTTPTLTSIRQGFLTQCCPFYPQGQCKNGGDCIFRHDLFAQGAEEVLAEEFSLGKDSCPNDFDVQTPLAGRSYDRCKYFDQSCCRRGTSCRFTHEVESLPSDPPHHDTTVSEGILSVSTEPQGNDSSTCLQVGDNNPNSWSSPGNDDILAEAGSSAQGNSPVYCKFYPQGRCKSGDHCIFIHGPSLAQRSEEVPTEEPPWGRDCWADISGGQRLPSTGRTYGRCKFFDQGHCGKGASCRFTHQVESLTSETLYRDATTPGNDGFTLTAGSDQWLSPVNVRAPIASETSAQDISSEHCKFYSQGDCKNGDNCVFRHDPSFTRWDAESTDDAPAWDWGNWGEASRDDNPGGGRPSSSGQSRGRCKYFDQGYCGKGASCRFAHQVESLSSDPPYHDATAPGNDGSTQLVVDDVKRPSPINDHTPTGTETSAQDVSSEYCKFYSQGDCANGDNCVFRHDPSFTRWGAESTDDTPAWGDWGASRGDDLGGQRPSRGRSYARCKYFDQGHCKMGISCRFAHQVDTSSSDPLYNDATAPGNDDSTQLVENNDKRPSPINDHTPIGTGTSAQDVSSEYCKFYSQGDCANGDNCVFRHDPSFTRWGAESTDDTAVWGDWGEASRDDNPGGRRPSSSGQSRGRCKYFDQGHCKMGTSCRFTHQVDAPSSGGSTWMNDTCRNDNHSGMGIPARPETCKFFDSERCTKEVKRRSAHGGVNHRTFESPHSERSDCWNFSRGKCSRGDACKFRHAVPDVLSTEQATDPLADDDSIWEKDSWPVDNTSGSEGHSANAQIEKGKCREHSASSRPLPNDADVWPAESCPQDDPIVRSHGDQRLSPHHRTNNEVTHDGISNHHDLPVGNNACNSTTICRYTENSEETTVERPMFRCTVRFGRAAVVQEVTTAFESCQVILSNLPADVTEANIVDLVEPFGNTTMILIENSPMTPPSAHVNYAQNAHASRAVNCLNGTDYRSCKLNARLDNSAIEIGDKAFFSRKVKISWSAPALIAWAHYKTISIAKRQAEILDGKVFKTRKITASFIRPRKAQTHSFSVELKLPLGSESADILSFCTEATGITLGSPTYDLQSCINNVRDLLRSFGPMASFDVLSSDNSKSKIIALAQFRTAEAATMAAEDRQSSKPEFLNGNTIGIEHVHWVKYAIPSLQFKTIKASLDGLNQARDKEAKIHYRDRDLQGLDVDPVHIYIYSTNPKALGHLKIASESLISGELLVSDGKGIWDEYFNTRAGAYFIRMLNADSTFFVKCDTRMRTLHFCGPANHLGHVREMVIQQLGDVYAHRHVIHLNRGLIRPLVTGGLDLLRGDIGSEKVTLDVLTPSLTIRGNSSDVKRAQRNLATIEPTFSLRKWGTDVVCPVCACEATNADPVALFCGHVYCKPCLQHLLRSAAAPNFTPPRCVAKDHEAGIEKSTCGADIILDVICDMLSSSEEKSLLESSFSSHIRRQPENFRHCPTPECRVVYRPGNSGTVLQCPSCLSRFCPVCHVEFHEGLSCVEYQENLGA